MTDTDIQERKAAKWFIYIYGGIVSKLTFMSKKKKKIGTSVILIL